MEKNLKKAIFAGIGAAAAYSFLKGEGMFNKPRFFREYKAAEKYLSSYYENAVCSEMTKTKTGLCCVVTAQNKRFILNIHKTDKGEYVFSETAM